MNRFVDSLGNGIQQKKRVKLSTLAGALLGLSVITTASLAAKQYHDWQAAKTEIDTRIRKFGLDVDIDCSKPDHLGRYVSCDVTFKDPRLSDCHVHQTCEVQDTQECEIVVTMTARLMF